MAVVGSLENPMCFDLDDDDDDSLDSPPLSMESESDDDMIIFPITDLTGSEGSDSNIDGKTPKSPVEEKPKALMTLRQRRLSRALALEDNNRNVIRPIVLTTARRQWISAVKKTRQLSDPWAAFHIADLKTEVATRYRYNALKKSWTEDEVYIKMEIKAFNRGAMRQCYRLKKLSNFAKMDDWNHSMNYVAKHYIEDVNREVYFEDIRLQMDAKLWGEEYDRHNPPKKVDIFQMYALEFKARDGSPLYHLEHYIEGDYIKYNSNSGFVEENLRRTPQAFSHFSFERSGHQLIIVDIQGVGDLYTDPQIHTADGLDYGDGNLGPKGMALFFHSHVCNSICRSLRLTRFDLSATETVGLKQFIITPECGNTIVRGTEEMCFSPPTKDRIDLGRLLLSRQRSNSNSMSIGSNDSPVGSPYVDSEDDPLSPDSHVCPVSVRVRYCSESESTTMTEEERRVAFARSQMFKSRGSSVWHEINQINVNENKIGESILGQIHHEMAKYHEIGRFSRDHQDQEVDWETALFHEEHAASLGVLEAIVTLAKVYLDKERNVLVDLTIKETTENINLGLDYMEKAADAGDRCAMLYLADAYYSGQGLGTKRSRAWDEGLDWYQQALDTSEADEGGEYDSTMDYPTYMILARQAEMLGEGGHDLDKDAQRAGDLFNEAAESAMAAMKGRLATKYYEKAEECYGECEDE